MREGERRIRLVGKLLRMTRAGELTWESVCSPDVNEREDAAEGSEVYSVESGGLRFTIYQKRPRRFARDVGRAVSEAAVTGFALDHIERRYATRTILRVFSNKDQGEEIVTDIGDTPLLFDLYRAARKSVTSIDADIEAFIGQEERHAERHHG